MNDEAVRFDALTSLEAKERAEKGYMALIPTGCTEQHARHLPLDTDTFQVSKQAFEGARLAKYNWDTKILVLQAIPYGTASEHFGFPGTISLSQNTYSNMIKEIIHSLVKSGFSRISLLKGCGGHFIDGAVWEAKAECAELNKDLTMRIWKASDDWKGLHEEYFGDEGKGHAGAMETALALADRPELVKKDEMVDPEVRSLEEAYLKGGEAFLMSDMSSTGALGDPGPANDVDGNKIWRKIIENFAEKLRWAEDYDKRQNRM